MANGWAQWMVGLAFAVGCGGTPESSSKTTTSSGTTGTTDGGDDGTTPPDDTSDTDDSAVESDDQDDDGYDSSVDCDDTNPAVHPDAEEVPGDGLDNDCNPETCVGSGFQTTPVEWPLPGGYVDRTFAETSHPGDCASERPRWSLLELNGDSFQDIVVVRSPCGDVEPGLRAWTVYFGNASGFDPAVEWSLPAELPEGAMRVTGNPGGCDDNGKPRWSLRDITGDGLPDAVFTETCTGTDETLGTSNWRVFPNTGAGFGAGVDWQLPSGAPTGAYRSWSAIADCALGIAAHDLMDVDGDGDEDLIVTSSPCADGELGRSTWNVHENDGTRFAESARVFSLPSGYGDGTFWGPGHGGSCADNIPAWTVRDIDGDGLRDAVITAFDCAAGVVGTEAWWVHRGSATGFASEPTVWNLPSGFGTLAFDSTGGEADCASEQPRSWLADVDGDRRPEMVLTQSPCGDGALGVSEWAVYHSSATGFSEEAEPWFVPPTYGAGTFFALGAPRECSPNIPGWSMVDVDNDGVQDMLVTSDACLTEGVGDAIWWVHPGGCVL